MITRDRAVELVEAQLARQWEESPAEWSFPELAVAGAQEHEVGWLLAVDSAEYLRTGDLRLRTTGWCGTYLVDRFDGSVHWLSPLAYTDDWQERYLRQVKGGTGFDPLVIALREVLRTSGTAAAMQYLRRRAPALGLREAKDFTVTVARGERPAPDLVRLTWTEEPDIETLAGPLA
ncbi:YrhB domain-containing protein [Kitasatospora sp. NPDC004745]|uniref:YrhB domain-containing protein n=1 Tax=Kitasatospora sp. NPDC004745 TaxID=3364019 RepID=UPI0036B22E8E